MHSEILSGLWISSHKSLHNKRFVYDKNISFIINLTNTDIDDKYMNVANGPKIDILNIPIDDSYNIKYNNIYLLDNMTDILSKINTKLVNHNILISCYSGFHASVTIACCYLLKYGNVNLEYAYNSIISKNTKLTDIKNYYMYCINNFIILLKKNNV
tara:strand:+ start:532 stop:1002 length:471 start_codon:yes stop_codon:yes gene_type:complete